MKKYIFVTLLFVSRLAFASSDFYYGLNDVGDKVGQRFYCSGTQGSVPCGIKMKADGSVQEYVSSYDTLMSDINDNGVAVGQVSMTAGGSIQAATCGTTSCYPISASLLGYPTWSRAERINNVGQILIRSSKTVITGFRKSKAVYTEYLLAGGYASPLPKENGLTTYSSALNNYGHTGGIYYSADGTHGFGFIRANGVVTVLEYPNALYTDVKGVNDNGDAAGEACFETNWAYLPSATCLNLFGWKWNHSTGEFTTFPTRQLDLNNSGQSVN